MRDLLTPRKPIPIPVSSAKSRSAIESRFPHIVAELIARWHTSSINPYMDSLVMDCRGGRRGFPDDVLEEVMFLSGLLWHMEHMGNVPMDFQKPEVFSCASVNETGLRRCGSTEAWVLV